MIRRLAIALTLIATAVPLWAQDSVVMGTGASMRAMDKISGDVIDFDLTPGQTKQMGRIQVTLGECRYPQNKSAAEAFAWIVVRNAGVEAPVFEGWMIASSPALNALDHARYDVWVLRCTTA